MVGAPGVRRQGEAHVTHGRRCSGNGAQRRAWQERLLCRQARGGGDLKDTKQALQQNRTQARGQPRPKVCPNGCTYAYHRRGEDVNFAAGAERCQMRRSGVRRIDASYALTRKSAPKVPEMPIAATTTPDVPAATA